MSSKSIFYQSPRLYIWGLKHIHGADFDKRYRFMASFAKNNDSVLEPACGPAILVDYLPPSVNYYGFDTNDRFVKYAQSRGVNASVGNVLDQNNYKPADVVVVCDILHHLKPADRSVFIKYCYQSAKKYLVICDPVVKPEPNYLKNTWDSLMFAIAEQDGVNQPKREECYTRERLVKEANDGFGVIEDRKELVITEIGEDLIIVYQKQQLLDSPVEAI
ncbi:MAG: class I SAM-dependent methyltransferase [bacterium]